MKTRERYYGDGEEENFKHSKSVTSFRPVPTVPWAFQSRDVMLSVLQARLKLLTFVLPKLCDGGHHECVQRILREIAVGIAVAKMSLSKYVKMYIGHWRHCEK